LTTVGIGFPCILAYNMIQLSFDIALLTGSSKVHLHALGMQMQ